jgi:type VI secretion system protein ImpK
VTALDEPSRFAVPIWVMAAGAAVLTTIVYVTLSTLLSSRVTELSALVRSMPPATQSEVLRPPPERPAAAPPPVKVEFRLLPEFQAAAPAELRGALKGHETVSLATLLIQASNPEVFQSSRAELTDSFQPLIAAIAKVITDNKDLIGNITVVGHTDGIPLQRSNPLSNNQRLSEARAQTIADLLVQYGVPRERIRSEGRAATEPIADDSTRDGRALNRRVEVLVEKRL